jgi:glycogen debranching enzyme
MIMNLPKQDDVGNVEYTLIEPFQSNGENKSIYSDGEHDFIIIEPNRNRIGTQIFDVNLLYPGVFFFQFKYGDKLYTEPQWIQVDSDLSSGDANISVSSLRIQTVLSRSLGKFDRWEEFICTQKELGYNAIHLTPIQTYGCSRSHYSLADQLNIDDWFINDPKTTKEDRFEKLKFHINKMQLEQGMLFFIDIVLNHTAGNSEWIKQQPEATYNTHNHPHLTSAYILDKALTEFDIKFSNGELKALPFCPYVKTEDEFEQVMSHIKNTIITPIRMYEFFQIDTDKLPDEAEIENLTKQIHELHKNDPVLHENEDLTSYIWGKVTNQGVARYGVEIKVRALLRLILSMEPGKEHLYYMNKIIHSCEDYNKEAKSMVDGFMEEAYNALRGEIHYFKLEINDPKVRLPEQRMITSYFRMLDNPQKTVCVHNGWSMGGNAAKQDF